MQLSRLLNEPTVIAGAIRAVILAVTAFGVQLTAEQIAATMLAVEAVLTLITRALVVPVALGEQRQALGLNPMKSADKQ